ncbi:RHS repeat-associated core domain-containing protein [Bacteroides oleiciplenus YIT 12058]|uniref:RHS repeat-associated core domain-containing protein n=2 Tax=Bacteroides oleiciplenus TaxID=626931 RepID=K9EEP6_9BACE|nr:RHS repeat-associated core domain-containing protein [Bacteroides oleiciplenus YIT 12058]
MHKTAIANISVPMRQIKELAASQVSQTHTVDYCGNVIYENGSLSKVLTEEGYATLDGTIPTFYYYLRDHQGNNRMVVRLNGTSWNTEQMNHYYPFGGVFEVNTETSGKQSYKYNGKELDRMHGLDWYDYGARMMDATLGRWHVVDPLAEKYYSTSPYVYCGNNPVRYIDPTGMLYTGYTVDKDGYIQKVNNEGGDKYDVLYNKDNYSSAKIKDYDTSGNKTGIQISKGILNEQAGESRNMSTKAMKGPYVDSEGHKTGKSYANHSYEVQDDKESLNLMNFLDKNTNVEWANTLMKNAQGVSINLLSTSHNGTTVEAGSYQTAKYTLNGIQIIRADHIHPTPGAIKPSDEDGDRGNAANILKHSPNAIFRILNQGKYYPYNP